MHLLLTAKPTRFIWIVFFSLLINSAQHIYIRYHYINIKLLFLFPINACMLKNKLLSLLLLLSTCISAQTSPSDTLLSNNKDLGDVFHSLFHKHIVHHKEDSAKKYYISFIPAAGYSLQTGWAAVISGNLAFKNSSSPTQKESSITSSFTYSQYNQTIIPFIANIWTKDNKLNFTTDFRFIQYPSDIYGLGGRTDPNQGYTINFTGLKLHQSVQKQIANNLYVGLGLYYDQYWNIKALDSLKRNIAHRLANKLGTAEISSGVALKFLYDSRLNQINPQQGFYANMVYRPSFKFLGSDENWESLLADVRTYLPFPRSSHNILAFWGLAWLSVGSNTPPYLMLPSTGWDENYNTGRGYIQGRFRGKNMFYAETEYRARLTRNNLVHGVLFLNAEKFSDDLSPTYTIIKPGYGLGIRLNLNKTSSTNVCLDYGFGNNGSRGFFVNIGEVF